MCGGSSSDPRILSREEERHIEEAVQREERVTRSQEGLKQAPRRAAQIPPAQKFEFAEEAEVSKSGWMLLRDNQFPVELMQGLRG